MALGRIALAWAAVAAWLLVWMVVQRQLVRSTGRPRRRDGWWVAGEALLLTLLGGLWFASLGAGTAWLIFLLVGALAEWPVRTVVGATRVGRVVAAGVLLSRLLGP